MPFARTLAALALAGCAAPEPTDTSSRVTSSTTTPPTCPDTGTSSSVTVGGDPDHRLYVDHGEACLYGYVPADEPFSIDVQVLVTCGGEILASSCDVTVESGVVTLRTTFEYVYEDLDSGVTCTPYPVGPTCEIPALPEGDYALCYGEDVLAFAVPGDDAQDCAE